MRLGILGLCALAMCGLACAQMVEENSQVFIYNGSWAPSNDPSASGGAYVTGGSVGGTVTFTVNGGSFALYRKMDPAGGYAAVTVDGKDYGNISFYFPETRWQVPAVLDQLGAGSHTIVLTVSQARPNGSGGNNVYIDALQNPIPAALAASEVQQSAVDRTNFYRNIMGLPRVRHLSSLGLAATAHGKYLTDVDFIRRGSSPHIETLGASPNFTGASPSDRGAYFGFSGAFVAEDANNVNDPITFIDGWMDGVYHREPFTLYSYTEIGYGGAQSGSAVDFASRITGPLRPSAFTVTTFPADGQTDVWLTYDGSDGPNNVTRGGSYGYPINLAITYPVGAAAGNTTITPTVGTLTDAAGNAIPVTVADSNTDSQLSTCVMIPNQPLAPSTTYIARMGGVDGMNNRFDKTWKFTTANIYSVHNVRPARGSNTYVYSINWDMVGGTVASQLEYGPTTAYGNVIAGELFPGRQSTFRALVPGLLVNAGVVHYRVTSKDAQGNVMYASPDHLLINTQSIPAATAGYVTVFPDAESTSIRWETAGEVASSQINYGLTTAYGQTAQASLFDGYKTWFYADLPNLQRGATYNYQIVTTDTQGNTLRTANATFVIP